MITFPARDIFEGLIKKPPDKCKYVFLADNAFFAEALQPSTNNTEYMTVYISTQSEANAYTMDEFCTLVNSYSPETTYLSDFYFLPIGNKSRNEKLREVLKGRGCKCSTDAWKTFSQGADYFQQNEKALMEAAQGAINKCKGKRTICVKTQKVRRIAGLGNGNFCRVLS